MSSFRPAIDSRLALTSRKFWSECNWLLLMECRSWLIEALTSKLFLMISFVLLFRKLRAGSYATDLL